MSFAQLKSVVFGFTSLAQDVNYTMIILLGFDMPSIPVNCVALAFHYITMFLDVCFRWAANLIACACHCAKDLAARTLQKLVSLLTKFWGVVLMVVFKIAYEWRYRCDYSRELTLSAKRVHTILANGNHQPGTIVEVENLHRAILTPAENAEWSVIETRMLGEFLLGVWYCARDLVSGAAKQIDLSDGNIHALMNHTCFNNLFDHAKRRDGEYKVDLTVFKDYKVAPGYVCYGAKGLFDFDPSRREAVLQEIVLTDANGAAIAVRPLDANGDADLNWDTAKMHFIICCDNEVLFNHHAHVHISTMRLVKAVRLLPPTDPIRMAIEAVSHHVTVLNEHIYEILYKYTSPLYPTALHMDAIQDIHRRGHHNEYFDELSRGLLRDCDYQLFNTKGFEMILDAVNLAFANLPPSYEAEVNGSSDHQDFVAAAREIIGPQISKELDLELVTVFDALKMIVTKILTDVLIVSDCEHHQVRMLGFHKSLLRCKKELDGTPVTFDNSQYLMDVVSRILFRTVFSGDHPVEAAMNHALVNGAGLPGLNLHIDRTVLEKFGANYLTYIDVKKMATSIDY